jgi:hypothetical protein
VTKYTVLYDSCVLYPAPLRDFLMRLALTDLFRAKWTNKIHEEWISNLLEKRQDLDRRALERTKTLMDSHIRDCLVEGYEYLIDTLTLPDPGDRHVLAAAIHSRCDAIITFNLKDFPAESLAPYNLEALHPDDFITLQIELSHQRVVSAAKEHRESLKKDPKTPEEYLDTLLRQELPETVAYLRQYRQLI